MGWFYEAGSGEMMVVRSKYISGTATYLNHRTTNEPSNVQGHPSGPFIGAIYWGYPSGPSIGAINHALCYVVLWWFQRHTHRYIIIIALHSSRQLLIT